uniref:Reverse transcriptase domain-containing protein n=1 Tax=Tanacetum cinerariifolium TaxID=118510 RepID=A0A6L2NLE6_TANCI|nr:reverse transcriptase domain-containing protein [Tanacetum cinerariifolium]
MTPATTLLLGFRGEISWLFGQILLMVSLGDEEHSTSAMMNFMIVRSPSPYNDIIGRSGFRKIQAVPSTMHEMLKFLVQDGVVTLHSSTVVPTECRIVTKTPTKLPPNAPTTKSGIKIAIHPKYLKQTIKIGESLSEKGRMELYDLLRNILDIFAWKLVDMTGIPRSIAEHRLNIREGCPLIRQKRKGQALDQNNATQEEVTKLVEAQIMRAVHYHSWISNPGMIPFQMLPRRQQRVPSNTDGRGRRGEFHTSQGVYCYIKMSFSLKNVKPTYQRLVDKAFKERIRRNIEVYVDDLVIMSHTEQEILRDIEETFQTLRKINIKLNPKKCTFGAEEWMFLGHVVNMKGTKACSEKAKEVIKLQLPWTLKEVQSFNEKLASLNRFLSKSMKKSLPFLKTLKNCIKKSDFQWTVEAKKEFQEMKQCITELPMSTAPKPKEELIMYLYAAREVLNGKFDIGLGTCLKKAMKIFELGAFDINYRPRTSIRGQVIADFITEWPNEYGPPIGIPIEEEIPEQ